MKTCYGPPASPFVSIDSLTGAARQSPTSICPFGQRRSGGILRRSVFLPVYNLKSTHRRSRFSFPNARLGVAPRRFAVTDQTVMAPPPRSGSGEKPSSFRSSPDSPLEENGLELSVAGRERVSPLRG